MFWAGEQGSVALTRLMWSPWGAGRFCGYTPEEVLMFMVTSATGHVGGELVRILAEADHPVRALDRQDGQADLPAGVETVTGNPPGGPT